MAGNGFKVADAYADFHVDVDKGLDEAAARIKARGADFDKLGRDAATHVSDGVTKSAPKLKAAGDKAGDELGKGTTEGYTRRTKEVDKATERVAQRTQAQFKALQFAGAFAGLPVAAAAGAAGVGAALGGVPLLFVGIAAAALRNNEQVASSFTKLKTSVVNDVTAMAAPMAGPLAGAADALGASFTRLKPQIAAAMTGSVPAVHLLTDSVTAFAENAMPGLLVAVKNSVPPLEGFKSVAGQVGAGFTDMWTNMAAGSQGAKTGLIQFGGVARDLLGFAGSLFAEFANGSAGVLPQFRAALGQVEGALLTVAHQAMPLAQGAASGFMGTIGGVASVVGVAAHALGGWAQPLGQFGGSLFATNSIARLFGTSLGETGFGLRAFAGHVDAAGNKTTPFSAAMKEAGTGGAAKFNAGLGSLINSGFNPLGLALIAGSVLLDKLGQAQQRAAEFTAAHREGVRTLTDALRQDNGVLGEHSAAVNTEALMSANAEKGLQLYGGSLGLAKLAIEGNTGAMGALQGKSNDFIASMGKQVGLSGENITALQGISTNLLTTGGNYDDVKGRVAQLGQSTEASMVKQVDGVTSMQVATHTLTKAQRDQLDSLMRANTAVGEQVKRQKEAHDAYLVAESALTGLTMAQIEARDATNEHTTALYKEQDALLAGRGAVLNTQDALDKYNKTMGDSKATDQEKAKALLDLERAFSAQEQAVYNSAYASSQATTDAGKQTEAYAAMRAETVRLANSFQGTLPQSMVETISKFNATEAAAAGLKTGVNNVGQAVYVLPNGKTVVISGDTKQARDAINALPAVADNTKGTVVIGANTNPATGKTLAAVQYADGSRGTITIDGNKDPATGKTMIAVQYANGQRSFMTVDAFNAAAMGKTLEAKRNADGTVAWIIVDANTGAANAAIDWAARARTASLTIQTSFSGPGAGMMTGPSRAVATGGLVTRGGVQHRGFADGGLVQRYASGGMTDVTAGGLLSGPGGPRGDKISALVSDKEFVVNAASTARNLAALIYANRGGTVVPAPRGAASISANPGAPAAAATPAAPTITHYNTFNVQEVDVYTLATRVSRELSLRSRTGASM